jgi:outer membrane protein TolC
MRFSTVVFCTLAVVVAKDLTRQAIATSAPGPDETKESAVRVSIPAKPELTPAIAPPEAAPDKPFADLGEGDRLTSNSSSSESDAKTENQETPRPETISRVEAAESPEWATIAPQSDMGSRIEVAAISPEWAAVAPQSDIGVTIPVFLEPDADFQAPDFQAPDFQAPDSQIPDSQIPDSQVPFAPDPLETSEEFDPDPNPLYVPSRPEEVEVGDAVPITLQQAVELAQRNSLDLQTAQLELERSQSELREAEAANFPRVAAGANLTLQQSENSSGLSNQLEEALGIESSNSSTAAALGGSVELNYDLFTSGRRPAQINAAEGRVQLQRLQVEVTSEATLLEVVNDYYDLQEADEQVRIAQASVVEAEASLRDTTALEQAGIGTRFEQLQAEVTVANARQNLAEALSQQQVSRRQLRQRLGLGESVNIAAADPVELAGDWLPSLEESIILAYQNRAELEQQLVQREVSQQQRRAALADLRPQVSAFANFGVQDSLDQEGGFNDNYQLGLRFSLNLFDGGATRARAAQEDSNIAIAETQFAAARNQVRLEVEQAYFTLQSSFTNTRTAMQAVDVATEALRLARLRYQAGVGTQTEVSQAQADLTTAELNRLQAILGYNRSLASLQRAVGNFAVESLALAV